MRKKMKKTISNYLKKLLVAALFGSLSQLSWAGSSQGTITNILQMSAGILIFAAGPMNGRAACSTIGNEWAIDVNTSGGRAFQASLLMAFAMGKTIYVAGTGACSAWGDREAPSHFQILN
jgi:hypothetical protein